MTFTDWFILGATCLIAVVDVILAVVKAPTVSRRLRYYGTRVSAVPFVWGVLGGHFWRPDIDLFFGSQWISIGLLIGATLAVLGFHFFLRWVTKPPVWLSLVYLVLGIPVGVFLWPI